MTASSYDAVPYETQPFSETHPDTLAALGILHGLTPPEVATARVLELGSADGGNLIPMALVLPKARFVGIDYSPRQVAAGQETIRRLGLTNIELVERSITDLGPDLGSFDYIICHGVYSWVPEMVRRKILEVCRQALAPGGIAFVSYNTFPGWSSLSQARALMLQHDQADLDPPARLERLRAFLADFMAALPDRDSPYVQTWLREVQPVLKKSDSYLAHEYLETVNEAFYFRDFVAEAARHGLRYLTDARFRNTEHSQPETIRAALDRWGGNDPIRREQDLDFLRNRAFRRSLLVGEEVEPGPPSVSALERLRVLTLSGPVGTLGDPTSVGPAEFATQDGQHRIKTNNPSLKTALAILCQSWPRSVPFPELTSRVAAALQGADGGTLATLPESLLRCYSAGVLALSTWEPPFVTDVSDRPLGSPYARLQAASGTRRLTSLRHHMVQLSAFDCLVLQGCDGQNDHPALVQRLVTAALDGTFPLTQDGRTLHDALEVRPILERSLPPSLLRLRGSAMLMG